MHVAVAVPVAGAPGGAVRGLLIAALPATTSSRASTPSPAGRPHRGDPEGRRRGVTLAVNAGASPRRAGCRLGRDPRTILEVAYWADPGRQGRVDPDRGNRRRGGAARLAIGWAWGNWLRRAYTADGKVVVDSVRDLKRFQRQGSRQPTELAETADLLRALQTAQDRRPCRDGSAPPAPAALATAPEPAAAAPAAPPGGAARVQRGGVPRLRHPRIYGETLTQHSRTSSGAPSVARSSSAASSRSRSGATAGRRASRSPRR